VNNLPCDVMSQCFGISSIIGVDVSGEWTMKGGNYGDILSGYSIMKNFFSFSSFFSSSSSSSTTSPRSIKIPSMGDISSQLAYVSAVKQIETAKNFFTDLYLQPPIRHFGIMDFQKINEILSASDPYVSSMISKYKQHQSSFFSSRLIRQGGGGVVSNNNSSQILDVDDEDISFKGRGKRRRIIRSGGNNKRRNRGRRDQNSSSLSDKRNIRSHSTSPHRSSSLSNLSNYSSSNQHHQEEEEERASIDGMDGDDQNDDQDYYGHLGNETSSSSRGRRRRRSQDDHHLHVPNLDQFRSTFSNEDQDQDENQNHHLIHLSSSYPIRKVSSLNQST